MEYAREAADFSSGYKLPQLQFAVNHYGQPDVAMFDFTSMYAAENASRVLQEKGCKLLMCLVGDSLLEVSKGVLAEWGNEVRKGRLCLITPIFVICDPS